MYLVIAETCLFVVCSLVFEIVRWKSFNYNQNKQRENDKPAELPSSLKILEDLRGNLSIPELKKKYPKENVLIYQNKVYNLGYYIHPGGQYFFEACRWREVSRFIHGAVGLESMNNQPWAHSEAAQHVLESHCIGDLILEGENGTNIILRDQNGFPKISKVDDEWVLNSRKRISPTTAMLLFKSKTLKVKLNCTGIDWIGRHYTISDGEKSRPYTNCTSLAAESCQHRRSIVTFLEQTMNKDGKIDPVIKLEEFIDYLPICVKQYEGKKPLSKKLVSGDQGITYSVQGPIGRGIEIPANFNGHVLLIGAGTGILPFLDLLEFLLKKAIYSICKREGIDTSFIQPQQVYESFFPGATFTLLSAFRTVDDFIGLDCITDLFKVCKKYKLDMFDALIKVKGLSPEHGLPTTDAQFSTNLLQKFTNKNSEELILICGPPPMQSSLYQSLKQDLKVPDDRIVFV